ncbi:hypothetical protein pA_gene0067 [Vibrio phage 13VT501A]|nr:hypothetical protein pA_gene0067 [Vibrio phage 13VT501A]
MANRHKPTLIGDEKMKSDCENWLSMFEKIESAEDCPCGIDLVVWDGCDFHIDYVDIDADTGAFYFANGTEGIAFFELPKKDSAALHLGDGKSW